MARDSHQTRDTVRRGSQSLPASITTDRIRYCLTTEADNGDKHDGRQPVSEPQALATDAVGLVVFFSNSFHNCSSQQETIHTEKQRLRGESVCRKEVNLVIE